MQWKDQCASYSFTTKKLTHSMCQVSVVVKYIIDIIKSECFTFISDDGKIFVGSGIGDPFGPRCHQGNLFTCKSDLILI